MAVPAPQSTTNSAGMVVGSSSVTAVKIHGRAEHAGQSRDDDGNAGRRIRQVQSRGADPILAGGHAGSEEIKRPDRPPPEIRQIEGQRARTLGHHQSGRRGNVQPHLAGAGVQCRNSRGFTGEYAEGIDRGTHGYLLHGVSRKAAALPENGDQSVRAHEHNGAGEQGLAAVGAYQGGVVERDRLRRCAPIPLPSRGPRSRSVRWRPPKPAWRRSSHRSMQRCPEYRRAAVVVGVVVVWFAAVRVPYATARVPALREASCPTPVLPVEFDAVDFAIGRVWPGRWTRRGRRRSRCRRSRCRRPRRC